MQAELNPTTPRTTGISPPGTYGIPTNNGTSRNSPSAEKRMGLGFLLAEPMEEFSAFPSSAELQGRKSRSQPDPGFLSGNSGRDSHAS